MEEGSRGGSVFHPNSHNWKVMGPDLKVAGRAKGQFRGRTTTKHEMKPCVCENSMEPSSNALSPSPKFLPHLQTRDRDSTQQVGHLNYQSGTGTADTLTTDTQTKKAYFSQKPTVTGHSLHGNRTALPKLISFKSVH